MAMQKMQAEIAKIGAEMARFQADAMRLEAAALRSKVDSQYAAMQAGAVVAANPHVAPVGDAILQESGWKDAQQQGVPPPDMVGQQAAGIPQGNPVQPTGNSQPDSPFTGVTAGIETAEVPQ